MRKLIGLTVAGILVIAGCATDRNYGGDQSISIPYDPYDFNPAELQAEADAHCEAFGMRAVYEDETIDPQSVRWRYRHYACV